MPSSVIIWGPNNEGPVRAYIGDNDTVDTIGRKVAPHLVDEEGDGYSLLPHAAPGEANGRLRQDLPVIDQVDAEEPLTLEVLRFPEPNPVAAVVDKLASYWQRRRRLKRKGR